MLEKSDLRNPNIKIYDYKDFNDLRKQIKNNGDYIFKFKDI